MIICCLLVSNGLWSFCCKSICARYKIKSQRRATLLSPILHQWRWYMSDVWEFALHQASARANGLNQSSNTGMFERVCDTADIFILPPSVLWQYIFNTGRDDISHWMADFIVWWMSLICYVNVCSFNNHQGVLHIMATEICFWIRSSKSPMKRWDIQVSS